MWSDAEAIDEMMVVSEIGEQWSPKTPPPRTAARYNGSEPSRAAARGTAIGTMRAKVPQDVPVAKAMKEASTKEPQTATLALAAPPMMPAT